MAENEYALEYLPAAVNDLTEIVSTYLMLEYEEGAKRIKNKLMKSTKRIQFMPYSGTVVLDKKMAQFGFRMVVIEKYLMFYKVFEEDKKVVIYRILNGKTNYPALMNKLYSE